jgi:hypothetical protein
LVSAIRDKITVGRGVVDRDGHCDGLGSATCGNLGPSDVYDVIAPKAFQTILE